MKNRSAFTLFELLIVIAIMAILGGIAMGGYRAMERGVAERSTLRSLNQFVRAAYHRAQIDKVPVAVFYWNETLRNETDMDPPVVVGKAVAIKRVGRITKITGSAIYDEFNDLQFFNSKFVKSESGAIWMYKMNGDEGANMERSRISKETFGESAQLTLVLGDGTSKTIQDYCYKLLDGAGEWGCGDAYGFEFLDITLPHNFIFGDEYSKKTSDPIKGNGGLWFNPSANSGNGARDGVVGKATIKVSSLRPDEKGAITVFDVGESIDPSQKMDKR
jgi:prepilin-type N-terminal cleavage/methylation domain-containing protein